MKSLKMWIMRYMVRAGLLLSALALKVDKAAWDKLPKDVQAEYTEKDGAYVLSVDGLEDTTGLKKALDSERKAHRDAEKLFKELEKRFEGIDPEAVRDLMSKLETDEDTKLIAKGKIDEVVNRRVEQMRKEFDKKLADAAKLTEMEKGRTKKYSDRVLDNAIRAAATKAGLHPHAVEDALFRARSLFTLSEEGDAVQLDDTGHAKIGKDGKSPFSPTEWLEGMKEAAPHWFPANSGGTGARGDGGGNAGGKRIVKRAEFDKMDAPTQMKTSKEVTEGKAVLQD